MHKINKFIKDYNEKKYVETHQSAYIVYNIVICFFIILHKVF